MDKELFRKTEGALYGYYKDLRRIEAVRKEISILNKIIDDLDSNIRSCNVKIDPSQNGAGICEKVQTSPDGTSYAEKEIIKGIDRMEKETAQRINKLFKLECEERNLSYKIQKMNINIDMLSDECKKFLDLKYNKQLGMRALALEMNMSKNTAYSLRESIVNNIAMFRWN